MIARLLFRWTAGRPCRLINRTNGARYMERYYLGRLFGWTFYLHRFVAADADEWVHDHPWNISVALVLAGSYREERVTALDPWAGWHWKLRRIGGWRRINVIRGGDFHRIAACRPETWTLFAHSERSKGWGFLERSLAGQIVTYSQPFNTAENLGWHNWSPAGRDAGRAWFPAQEGA